MPKISQIDKNFIIKTELNKADIKFYNVLEEPFKIYGVYFDKNRFLRLPKAVAETVNDGVLNLHHNTSGGRILFKTDSPYVAIHTKMHHVGKMSHFALSGSIGFDLYASDSGEKEWYRGTFVPPYNIRSGYDSVIELGGAKMREITINMPTYSGVNEVYIGVAENSRVAFHREYTNKNKIVYYGSSITQGGCVSRPGNIYQNIICRDFDCDYWNLGFSGSARGETTITDYIKKLDMSVFVYDYDYNAPTVEHLSTTHEKMFKEIRKENKDLPVIMMSRPKFTLNDEEKERLKIIKKTYQNAIDSGDKNVYLIDGPTLMKTAGDDGTVDNCHPNDLGFYSMAKALSNVLKNIL